MLDQISDIESHRIGQNIDRSTVRFVFMGQASKTAVPCIPGGKHNAQNIK